MTKKITNPINTEKMKETKNKEFKSEFNELVGGFQKNMRELFTEYGHVKEAGIFFAAYTEDDISYAIMGLNTTAVENLTILCDRDKNARELISKTASGLLNNNN